MRAFRSAWFNVCLIGLGCLLVGSRIGLADSEATPPKVDEKLTLTRIFEGDEFAIQGYDAQWDADDDVLWRWEEAKLGGGKDLVRIDPLTDSRKTVVTAAQLAPPGESPLDVESFQWSTNRDKLLLFTNTKRVWRYRTRGDYWVYDRSSQVLRKLGGDAAEASLMFAKFSPQADAVAYVRDRQIWVESLLDGSIRSLTPLTSEDVINGTFDWVYEEELSARDGFRWSPDGRSIAYWQLDTSGVSKFTLVNNTDDFYPRIQQFAYPKTGQRNSACRIGIVSASGGDTNWLGIPGDSREHYLCRMQWNGSDSIYVQQLNRLQNTNRLYRVEVPSFETRLIMTEEDDAWVDVHDEWFWIEGGARFTWTSERDGWRHVYLVSADGQRQRQVTSGEYDVVQLLKVDEARQKIYFLASPDNPTQRYLYVTDFEGRNTTRVTPQRRAGTHRYSISPSGELAVHHWSSFGRPPRFELVRLDSHSVIRRLENNRPVRRKLRQLALGKREFFRVDVGDGVELDGWCIYPVGFDASRKYPLLVYVYGEPAGQTVLDQWSGSRYLWHQMMAQRGYFVASFDNRGTPAPRGRDWRKAVYRKVGVIAPDEQARAIRKLLAERPYLDAERVGVWGWSGGGSMTLNAMFKYPDLYRTGVSIAPVPNQRHYDTIYQERYMGLPSDNVEGYLQGSPIHFADQLQGNLLLIHGTGDDNCHYQTTESLINELIRHGKPFQMMAYPNRTHSIREGSGTTMHLWQLVTQYLKRNLPAGPR